MRWSCRGMSQHRICATRRYVLHFRDYHLTFCLCERLHIRFTVSLYTYIHALIQAQRIILLLYIAQPYRLRIYFKSYGSRSPVTETYRHLSTPSSRPYRPYYTLTRTLTATHSAVKATVTYPNIYISRPSIPQGYARLTHAAWLPHVRHMAPT